MIVILLMFSYLSMFEPKLEQVTFSLTNSQISKKQKLVKHHDKSLNIEKS